MTKGRATTWQERMDIVLYYKDNLVPGTSVSI